MTLTVATNSQVMDKCAGPGGTEPGSSYVTPMERGCEDRSCKAPECKSVALGDHHHHGMACLAYDVWPYTKAAQRAHTFDVLGGKMMLMDGSVASPVAKIHEYAWLQGGAAGKAARAARPRAAAPADFGPAPWRGTRRDLYVIGCPKLSYPDEELANIALFAIQDEEDDYEIESYYHRDCGRWHLGH